MANTSADENEQRLAETDSDGGDMNELLDDIEKTFQDLRDEVEMKDDIINKLTTQLKTKTRPCNNCGPMQIILNGVEEKLLRAESEYDQNVWSLEESFQKAQNERFQVQKKLAKSKKRHRATVAKMKSAIDAQKREIEHLIAENKQLFAHQGKREEKKRESIPIAQLTKDFSDLKLESEHVKQTGSTPPPHGEPPLEKSIQDGKGAPQRTPIECKDKQKGANAKQRNIWQTGWHSKENPSLPRYNHGWRW